MTTKNPKNEQTVYNPKKPGTVEKVEPNTGETTPRPTNPKKD